VGLHITPHLNYNAGMELLADSASRALGLLVSKYKVMKYMGFNTFETLYKSAVVPIMDYASEIWGARKFNKNEIVQNRAARSFLGVHRFAPCDGMQGDLGWISCRSRRKTNMIRFWNRMLKMDDTRLTKQIFMWDHNIANNNWNTEVKQIFEELSLDNKFYNREIADADLLGTEIKKYEETCWRERCLSKPKLRTYHKIKQTLETESYVKCNLNRKERSLLAQLRFGILPLKIETGRFENLPLENRICELCRLNKTEDETHFLFECEVNNNI
jgi:hypothetical protein